MPVDCHGRPVAVGTRVRLLTLAAFLKRDLPSDEWAELETMVGEVFEVIEIDDQGTPWIEKVWHDPDGGSYSHSLALTASEMEVVENQEGSTSHET